MVPTAEPGLVRSRVSGSSRVSPARFAWCSGRSLARPKSRILTAPRSVTKMLAGLMSRWMMPFLWAASRASASWMPMSMERGSGAGFAEEAFERLRIAVRILGEEFQSDAAAELGVFGFVDDAHAAAAKFAEDFVMGNGFVEHGRGTERRW